MKIINDYVIVAKDVSVDSNDNTVSILKIVDNLEIATSSELCKQINAKNGNIFNSPVQFVIATSFSSAEKANKDFVFEILIEILSPDNKILGKFTKEFNLNKNTDKARININIQGMSIVGSGKYTLKVAALDQGKIIAEGTTSLNINIVEAPLPIQTTNK